MAKQKKNPFLPPESKISDDLSNGRMIGDQEIDPASAPQIAIMERGMVDSVFVELVRWAEGQANIQVKRTRQYTTIMNQFANAPAGARPRVIVVASIFNKQDLMELDRFLGWRRTGQLEMEIPVLVLTRFQTPQLWAYLRGRGCMTFLPGFTHVKELKQTLIKSFRLLEIAATRKIPEYLAVLFIAGAKLPQFKIVWEQCIDVAQDWWVIPTERFVYEMTAMWMISLLGPSPKSGHWEGSEQNQLWKWVPVSNGIKTGKGVKATGANWAAHDGLWHFRGKKPRYFGGRWFFIGVIPELYFLDSERTENHKFKVLGKHEIAIRPNSSNTLYRLADRTTGPLVEEEEVDFETGFILKPDIKADLNGEKKIKSKMHLDEHSRMVKDAEMAALAESELAVTLGKNKNYFSTLNDPEKLVTLLRELCSNKTSVHVWVRGKKGRASGNFRLIDEEKLRVALDFQVGRDSSIFCTELSEASDRKVLGFFKSSMGLIFFIVDQYEVLPMSQRFVLELKHVLFQVQRRKAARLPVPEDFPISVQVGPHMAKVADVSISGFGVFIEASRPPFKPGEIVPMIVLWQGSMLRFSVEVRWQKATARSRTFGSYHVGLYVKTTTLDEVTQLGLMLFELQTYENS